MEYIEIQLYEVNYARLCENSELNMSNILIKSLLFLVIYFLIITNFRHTISNIGTQLNIINRISKMG